MLPTIASRPAFFIVLSFVSPCLLVFRRCAASFGAGLHSMTVRFVERRYSCAVFCTVSGVTLLNWLTRSFTRLECRQREQSWRGDPSSRSRRIAHCVVETGAEFHPRAIERFLVDGVWCEAVRSPFDGFDNRFRLGCRIVVTSAASSIGPSVEHVAELLMRLRRCRSVRAFAPTPVAAGCRRLPISICSSRPMA